MSWKQKSNHCWGNLRMGPIICSQRDTPPLLHLCPDLYPARESIQWRQTTFITNKHCISARECHYLLKVKLDTQVNAELRHVTNTLPCDLCLGLQCLSLSCCSSDKSRKWKRYRLLTRKVYFLVLRPLDSLVADEMSNLSASTFLSTAHKNTRQL